MNFTIFCDFDGTVTTRDTTDEILKRFADPKWEEVERDWLDGKFGSEECLKRQMALVNAGEKEITELLDTIEIDQYFPSFVKYCDGRKYSLYIVSDGFDFVINHILGRYNLGHLPHFANSLTFKNGRPEASFPNGYHACNECATCKVALLRKLRGAKGTAVLIGDGFSDRYIAGKADYVIAKHKLREFCRGERIPYYSFETFEDVLQLMDKIKEIEEGNFEIKDGMQINEGKLAGI